MANEIDAVVYPTDAAREAKMGRIATLPTLQEALEKWTTQAVNEAPTDFATPFGALKLTATGRLSRGNGGMRLTYRVFGALLRAYCAAPRNIARCLVELPAAIDDKAATSPRSVAVNAYYAGGAQMNQDAKCVIRTRLLNGARTAVGAVSPTHSLTAGDDLVFIRALREYFSAAERNDMRATIYRGIEISELRVVIPAMRVEVAPGEWWSGYIVVRNSEIGAASWSISAGLIREMDAATKDAAQRLGFEGATLTVQTASKGGAHHGTKVAQRANEALQGVHKMLATLREGAAERALKTAKHDRLWIRERLERVVKDAGLTEEVETAQLDALLASSGEWSHQVTASSVIRTLAQLSTQVTRRSQQLPIERLMGRVLMEGVDAALEKIVRVEDVEEAE